MKKSEKLKLASASEENDFRALGLHLQSQREERQERFEEEYLPKMMASPNVLRRMTIADGYRFELRVYGLIGFYPKSDRVIIYSSQKWISSGLDWLIKNVLED